MVFRSFVMGFACLAVLCTSYCTSTNRGFRHVSGGLYSQLAESDEKIIKTKSGQLLVAYEVIVTSDSQQVFMKAAADCGDGFESLLDKPFEVKSISLDLIEKQKNDRVVVFYEPMPGKTTTLRNGQIMALPQEIVPIEFSMPVICQTSK